jgi:hypothetical protein
MSRTAVRAQVATYLSGAGVTFLNTVKPFPAKFTSEMEFFQGEDPGHSSGAIVYLYIASQKESRIALGGAHNGRKAMEYEFVLDCFMRSMHRKSEDAGADNDTFLDSLVTAIRADRNAGNPSLIFQWGEGNFPGGVDIDITSYYPRTINGSSTTTQVYSQVRVMVIEIDNA